MTDVPFKGNEHLPQKLTGLSTNQVVVQDHDKHIMDPCDSKVVRKQSFRSKHISSNDKALIEEKLHVLLKAYFTFEVYWLYIFTSNILPFQDKDKVITLPKSRMLFITILIH